MDAKKKLSKVDNRQATTRTINVLREAVTREASSDEVHRLCQILRSRVEKIGPLNDEIMAEIDDDSPESEYMDTLNKCEDAWITPEWLSHSTLGISLERNRF